MKSRLNCITILRQERNVLEGDRWSLIRPRISGLTYLAFIFSPHRD